jgi:hypothetical protein
LVKFVLQFEASQTAQYSVPILAQIVYKSPQLVL